MSKKKKKRRWYDLVQILNERDFCYQVLIRIPEPARNYFPDIMGIVKKVKFFMGNLGLQEQRGTFNVGQGEEQIICIPFFEKKSNSSGMIIVSTREDLGIISIKIMSCQLIKAEVIFVRLKEIFNAEHHNIRLLTAEYKIMDFNERE